MIYTLTLNPAVDYYIDVKNFQLGKLNLSETSNFSIGGKGINVSLMLKNLDTPSVAMGFLGGEIGEIVRSKLNELQIENDFVYICENTRINIKLKTLNPNDENYYQETEIAGVSPIISNQQCDNLYKKISGIKNNDFLIISGSIPESLSKTIYKNLTKNLSQVKIILDTRGEFIKENICNNFLIKPNISELSFLENKKLTTNTEIVHAARKLINCGAENIIVSLGKDGAMFVNAENIFIAKVPKAKVISSVCAGDSMVAGFVFAIENKMNMKDAFKFSVATGSATAFSKGLATKEKIYETLEKIKVTTL